MILVTCDTHCYYDTINQQIDYAENVLGRDITCIIHLGDFGIYKSHLHDFFIKKRTALQAAALFHRRQP